MSPARTSGKDIRGVSYHPAPISRLPQSVQRSGRHAPRRYSGTSAPPACVCWELAVARVLQCWREWSGGAGAALAGASGRGAGGGARAAARCPGGLPEAGLSGLPGAGYRVVSPPSRRGRATRILCLRPGGHHRRPRRGAPGSGALDALRSARFDQAQALFRQVAETEEARELAPEALYWVGIAGYLRDRDHAALRRAWRPLRERFPASSWAARTEYSDPEAGE